MLINVCNYVLWQMTGAQTLHLAFRSWHGWPIIAPRLFTHDRQNILWMWRSASQMLPLRLVPMSLHCQQPECLLAPPETCHWRKCSPSNGTKLFTKVIASLVLSLNAPTLSSYHLPQFLPGTVHWFEKEKMCARCGTKWRVCVAKQACPREVTERESAALPDSNEVISTGRQLFSFFFFSSVIIILVICIVYEQLSSTSSRDIPWTLNRNDLQLYSAILCFRSGLCQLSDSDSVRRLNIYNTD